PEAVPEVIDPDANGYEETIENFLDPQNIPPVEGEIPGIGRVRLRNGQFDFEPNREGGREDDRGRRRRNEDEDRAPPPEGYEDEQ
ncbi:MAG: penicillin-binding protein, partial [Sphingomonas sp.]